MVLQYVIGSGLTLEACPYILALMAYSPMLDNIILMMVERFLTLISLSETHILLT